MWTLTVVTCVVLALTTPIAGQQTDVTVNTTVGTFVGFKKNVSVDDTTVSLNKYLGIPYAEPPVGDLRFEKPVAKAALSEPLMTKIHGSECTQMTILGNPLPTSEDCLFLNVYAPDTTENGGPLAVMVWIHGGAYVAGSANSFVADLLAARGNIIVVTINYRLSILGFLNVGQGRPANFGLWDQRLAIQWVHDNIGAFGGDRDRITIAGESAGSGSVLFQGIYPGNEGLFQRIIAESGTPAAGFNSALDPLAEAEEFANLVGCSSLLPNRMFECLKNLPVDIINSTLNDFSNGLYRNPIPFLPSIDNDFIKENAKNVFDLKVNVGRAERNVLSTFDLLIGANSAEGAGAVEPTYGVYGDPENFLPNRTFFEETLIPKLVVDNFIEGDLQAVSKLLASVYTTWDDPNNPLNIRQNYVDMYGDMWFLFPGAQATDLHAEISTRGTYSYYFDAEPSTHLLPTPSWVGRPNHAEELLYVFGEANDFGLWATTGPFEDWEKELSKNIMTLWSNFVKTGNPNQPRSIGVNWEPYTRTNKEYLHITKFLNETATKENQVLERINMWDQVMPTVNDAVDRATLTCDVTDAASSAIAVPTAMIASLLMSLIYCKFYYL